MEKQVSSFSRVIYLLGTLRLQDAHGPCTLGGEKAQSLLAYLVLHPGLPHSRERLADLLFPEASFDRIRRNFSDTLYRVQKTLGGDWLIIEGETIALRVDDQLWVDVWEFDRLTTSSNPADLQQATTLYANDLLPACYDDWILPERELRRNQYLFALENLATHQETRGNLQQALLTTRRLILTEPLHEPAHQTYLRLLGRLQRYGEALTHYEYLRTLLRTELDTDPLAETQRILHALERERDLSTVPALAEERLPFVGRVLERALVLEAVEAALHSHGSIVALEGTAGIGKSRLLREIATGARWRRATVLQGTASEIPEASPFAPLANALAPLLNGPRAAHLETLLAPGTLAILAPLHPAWAAYATGTPSPAEPVGRYFFDALHPFGEALARLAPLVLILDDLHWANPDLWQCLQTLAPTLTQNGCLLLLAYRRPEIETTPGWKLLQTWERTGCAKILPLQPLTLPDLIQLLDNESPVPPDEIYAFTGGNPFLISEWVTEATPLPRPGESAITYRFRTLSLPAQTALQIAAVLGDIPYRIWADLMELPPLTLAALTDELTTHNWLQPAPAGYTFVHDLLRAAVYETLSPAQRRTYHARAAQAYQTHAPDNVRVRAFHLDQGGREAEAAQAYRQAGEQNLARFAYREAQTDLARALALMPRTRTLAWLETALAFALACENTSDRSAQRPVLEDALAVAFQLKNTEMLIQALLARGRAATKTLQFEEAEKDIRQALLLARKTKDTVNENKAIILLGVSANQQRNGRVASRYYTQALKLARKYGDRASEGRALSGLGISARDVGAPDKAVKWFEQAHTIFRETRDRRNEIISKANLLTALYDMRAWDRLVVTAGEVLPGTLEIGNRYSTAYVQHLQGLASFNLGDYTSAWQLFLKAQTGFEAVEMVHSAFMVRNTLGLILEEEGRYEEALQLYFELLKDTQRINADNETNFVQQDLGILLTRLERFSEAIPLLEKSQAAWIAMNDRLGQLRTEAYLGWAYRAVGEQTRAEALAMRGWAEFQAGIPFGEKPQDWLWALRRLLVALNQSESAQSLLQATYEELQYQARAITDAEQRRSFFEKVALNRDIVAAHDQQTGVIRTKSIPLARREAPLGRALREDELVTVPWTILAPEDETISDKTEQRLYRLKRLLREAEARGAAPTDDDLAYALNVSRRTILRDMQSLAEEIPRPPTRKRK